jgi:transcriptional regulator with XRE-family HTH domain
MADPSALLEFGKYLAAQRREAGFSSQRDAVRALARSRMGISQGLLAHYERGRVADPDARVLAQLASLYGADFLEWVVRLARAKYGEAKGTSDELAEARWDLLESALAPVDAIETAAGLGRDQLRARASLLREVDVIDAAGIATWQRSVPGLESFWVIAPYFLDDEDERVLEAVVENLRRGVRYTYFIYPSARARFAALLERFRARIGGRAKLRAPPEAVFLPPGAVPWLHADYIVANPTQRSRAVGFQNLRHLGKTRFALRLPAPDLLDLIDKVNAWRAAEESRTGGELVRTTLSSDPA